jgi:undecaprenyl diphosphate synthase
MNVSIEQIDKTKLPSHIAIIMDGNGRWAEEKGYKRLYGHMQGVESVRSVVEGAALVGISYLTLYAFSTENWKRPEEEVSGLMELLVNTIQKELPVLNEKNISLHVIGNLNRLPETARIELEDALQITKNNTGLNLILALSYSSRWEIVEAVKKIADDVKAGQLNPENINQQVFQQYLATADFPDPELMIRTSGEYRISNFLLYQSAYTELYFTETRWPDFKKENLYEAIVDFQNRERRFGKTSQQLKQEDKSLPLL